MRVANRSATFLALRSSKPCLERGEVLRHPPRDCREIGEVFEGLRHSESALLLDSKPLSPSAIKIYPHHNK